MLTFENWRFLGSFVKSREVTQVCNSVRPAASKVLVVAGRLFIKFDI